MGGYLDMTKNAFAALLLLMGGLAYSMPLNIGQEINPVGSQIVWPNDPDFEKYADHLQDIHVDWARFDLCWWSVAEQEKGAGYDFTSVLVDGHPWNTDAAIEALRARHIEPFPILCYSSPHYDNETGPSSPEGREAFAAYCRAAVERYRDQVTYWEIWNEPNLEMFWGTTPDPVHYAELVKVTAPVIREANPDAVIAGCATAHVDLPFLRTAFENGVLDHIDIVTVHPYRQQPPESAAEDIAAVRDMITEFTDRDIAIWTGEWGYNTFWSEVSEKGQAKCLARMMVSNLAAGVENSIWFSVHSFPESSGEEIKDPEWGLVDYDLEPRPSYYAMRTVNRNLGAPVRHVENMVEAGVDLDSEELRVEVFERGSSTRLTVAVWLAQWPADKDTYIGKKADFSVRVPESTWVKTVDGLTGETLDVEEDYEDGRLIVSNIRISDYPIYFHLALPETDSAVETQEAEEAPQEP